MSKTNGSGKMIRLDEARQKTPPVDPAEALRQDLRLQFFAAIGADGAAQLAAKLKERALAGDPKAMQLLVNLLAAAPPASSGPLVAQQFNVGGQAPREPDVPALRDDAADLIRLEGPLTSAVLADRIGTSAAAVERALAADDWFEAEQGGRGWSLTGKAYAALSADRD